MVEPPIFWKKYEQNSSIEVKHQRHINETSQTNNIMYYIYVYISICVDINLYKYMYIYIYLSIDGMGYPDFFHLVFSISSGVFRGKLTASMGDGSPDTRFTSKGPSIVAIFRAGRLYISTKRCCTQG